MGYLATEIIVLLAGAAVLGLILGWALFGLGKKTAYATAGASPSGPSPKVEGELKAERDARKKAEGRILELESKETSFNDRLQERDMKVAELTHQLDDLSKYRVQSAAEIDQRDQRISALEGQLRARDAAGPTAPGDANDKLAERERQIAKLKADLEAANATASPDATRLRDLERENAELRQTLIATDGAAPTTASEKDAIIARLNEEVTGLRAAYESAEQALEEQDAAIDKLTRDLQATQHKLAVATGQESASKPAPVSTTKPRPEISAPKPSEAVKPSMPAPAKAPEPAKAAEPAAKAPAPEPPKPAPAPAPAAAAAASAPSYASEATVAVSLADLVGQIDSKPSAKAAEPAAKAPEPAAKAPAPEPPKPAPAPAPAAAAAPAPSYASEATVAVSLADLVGQIDQKSPAPAPAAAPAPSSPPPSAGVPAPARPATYPPRMPEPPAPAPAPATAASESTVALSLDDLISQIDKKPAAPAVAATPAPAPAAAPSLVDQSESTVAVSLADLVGQIDGEPKVKFTPGPPGVMDDLKEIRGIGPATEKRLNSAGIKTWVQMADLSEAELIAVADLLKISVDKIKREQWVEQAKALGVKH